MNSALPIMFVFLIAAIFLAIRSGWGKKMNLEQWAVGGRSFGIVFVFLLLAGGFFTTFTFLGGSPDGICRHGEALAPDLGRPLISSTVFSIIMNMSQGTFELAAGQPCKTSYKMYGFTLRE
jgi:Na+/proline symporter